MPEDYKVDIRLAFDNGPELPIDLAAAFTIKQTRGLESFMFNVMLGKDKVEKFPPSASSPSGCKCKFIFKTPGESGGRVQSEWQLYLVRYEPASSQGDVFRVTFADERWKADHKRHTISYNVQWPDGSYRSETLNRGNPWRVIDAIEDAIKQFGGTPDVSRLKKAFKANPVLLNNLGDSEGGGWSFAPWTSILKPLLNQVNADLVIGFKREWIVVPRTAMVVGKTASSFNVTSEAVNRLRGMKRIDDTVGPTVGGWERPRKVRVGFEIKAEGVIESLYGAQTSSGGIAAFDVPYNVMPRELPTLLHPEAWWNDQVSDVNDTEWIRIDDQLAQLGYAAAGAAEATICRNYFLPLIIPFKRAGEFDEIQEVAGDPIANAVAIETKEWVDAALRRCWRTIYLVRFPDSNAPQAKDLRSLAKIRFGRLTPGGDTRSRGAVFCDWCEETSHAVQFTQNPFDAKFSQNHAFNPKRPSPFTASWVAQQGNELIYEIRPTESRRIGQARIFPGKFAKGKELNYGDWYKLTADNYLEDTELQGEFDTRFNFRIYAAGLLVAEDGRNNVSSPLGKIEGRTLIVERKLYSEGSIESLDIRAESTTANFGYSATQMARALGFLIDEWPTSLLNESTIKEIVNRAENKVRAQFDVEAAGGIRIAGVSPMAANIITEGDIHEMSVVVGDPDPWSITCQYIVLPNVTTMEIEPEDRDGAAPDLIAN